jgi:hypothetical protein
MSKNNLPRDYTYTDTKSHEILLICLACVNLIEADYMFKHVIGFYPWIDNRAFVSSSPTCLEIEEALYIPMED